jgi:hypothetical protein
MAPFADPPLAIAHRFVDSGAGLAYYLKRPDGVMWRRKALFDVPVYYVAFHGVPAGLSSLTGTIEAEELCDAFAGYGKGGYKSLVYFACCDVLRGERGRRFAREFLKRSGARAVIGYATHVDWMASLIADMLLLHRFYADPSPWRNLRRIFASVHRDYPRARKLRHTLILRGEAP